MLQPVHIIEQSAHTQSGKTVQRCNTNKSIGIENWTSFPTPDRSQRILSVLPPSPCYVTKQGDCITGLIYSTTDLVEFLECEISSLSDLWAHLRVQSDNSKLYSGVQQTCGDSLQSRTFGSSHEFEKPQYNRPGVFRPVESLDL